MKDVAQEAGVALGTVSKVFNGRPVGESYRVKVEAAARRLGYQVNEYARGLRAGKTYTVALILPGLDHPFFAALAQNICSALAQRDHRMLMYVTASRPDIEQSCINMVRQNKVDGIIGLTYNPVELDEDLPFISIDRCISSNVPCVASDNFGGGRMAAEKLIGLGCRRLAFLRIGSSSPSETDRRGDGFEMVCRMRNIPCDSLRLSDGDDLEQFRSFFHSHMTNGKLDIDGIFCSTDLLAWQIQNMLKELGIRVPEDVQIIGFDGIRRFGGQELYCSTIVQPLQKMAETAVDLLLTKDRSNIPAMVLLPVAYAPGGTTRE
ncbi:MAG: LacI family DNA-binding transcriptional regulator [Oscillospiraceae bacterium]|nr:LacI family DNA-binding transcriptional regulator [Oscillospiraceae bacterium]